MRGRLRLGRVRPLHAHTPHPLLPPAITNRPPCRGARRDATFDNILHRELRFPRGQPVSAEALDLIARLLAKVRAPCGAAAWLWWGARGAGVALVGGKGGWGAGG